MSLVNTILPDELLIMALANLDPFDLRLCAEVCRRWARVITDDTCWRMALESWMGGLTPRRRIAKTSWKNEYLRRFRLMREWKSPAKRVIQFDPRVGPISDLCVDYEDSRVFVGSIERGTVAVCNPTTGKVDRETIYFNRELERNAVGTLLIERSRILAGHLSGGITMATHFIGRPSVSHTLISSQGFHNGPVRVLKGLPNIPNILLSGGDDGLIYAWDLSNFRCIVKFVGCSGGVRFLSFDAKNHLVAVSEGCNICVWDIDLLQISKESPQDVSPIELPPSRIMKHPVTASNRQVHSFLHDSSSSIFVTATDEILPDGLALWNGKSTSPIVNFVPLVISDSPVKIVSWDRQMQSNSTSSIYLVSGHTDGTILLWDIQTNLTLSQETEGKCHALRPILNIQASSISPLVAMGVDPFKIITANSDGVIKSYHVCTGSHMRTVSLRRGMEPAFGEFEREDRKRITCLWSGQWNIIAATAGGHVCNWDFAPTQESRSRAGPKEKWWKKKNRVGQGRFLTNTGNESPVVSIAGSSRGSARKSFGNTKAQLAHDVKIELRATTEALKREREYDEQQKSTWAKYNGVNTGNVTPRLLSPPGAVGNAGSRHPMPNMCATSAKAQSSSSIVSLSEQELIDYAIMLSRDDMLETFSLGDAALNDSANLTQSEIWSPRTLTSSAQTSIPVIDSESIFTDSSEITRKDEKSKRDAKNHPQSPISNPWLSGRTFAAVVADGADSNLKESPSKILPFTESLPASRSSKSKVTYNSYRSRFPALWYEDEDFWDDEVEFYNNGVQDTEYIPTRWRSSLSMSLDNAIDYDINFEELSINGGQDERLSKSLRDSAKASLSSLSSSLSSLERNRYFVGCTSTESPTLSSIRPRDLRRSPRLGPMGTHVSPRLAPVSLSPSLAPTTNFVGVGVQVAPRATVQDEDEELMYVLELSLLEQ